MKNRIIASGVRLSVSGFLAAILLLIPHVSVFAEQKDAISPGTQFGFLVDGPSQIWKDQIVFEVTGRTEIILGITSFGRYSVAGKSKKGVSLEIIGQLQGPFAKDGEPGRSDGRLDVFLEKGLYQLILDNNNPGETAQVQLSLRPFEEVSPRDCPLLSEAVPFECELKDLQQVTTCLDLNDSGEINLEAAGRGLKDLRIWQDGQWLMEHEPVCSVQEPLTGNPLTVCRLSCRLDKGTYTVCAYGGVPLAWSSGDDAHPFYLKSGILSVLPSFRMSARIGPTGSDHYLVVDEASLVRIDLPQKSQVRLEACPVTEGNVFRTPLYVSMVDQYSLWPYAELFLSSLPEGGRYRITVTGMQDQPYNIQVIKTSRSNAFQLTGNYWISTVSAGMPSDWIDTTGILVKTVSKAKPEVAAVSAVRLDNASVFHRRFNLDRLATVQLQVTKTGRYGFISRGVDVKHRIEPFLASKPSNYKQPAVQSSGHVWDLEAGLYVLSIQPMPEQSGILEIAMASTGREELSFDLPALQSTQTSSSPCPIAQFESVVAETRLEHSIYLSTHDPSRTGYNLRKLPINLADGLTVSIAPGAAIELPCTAPDDGRVQIASESDWDPETNLDGAVSGTEFDVARGEHAIRLVNPSKDYWLGSLIFRPGSMTGSERIMPMSELASRMQLDRLPLQDPAFFDLEPHVQKLFMFEVDDPGLYTLQSTGLLSVDGAVRTRTEPYLFREIANGTGRNFIIQQFLGEGTYLGRIKTTGRSAGHLGVTLSRSRLFDGGELEVGTFAHDQAAPGEAIVYMLPIYESGKYHVSCRSMASESTAGNNTGDGTIRDSFEPDPGFEEGWGEQDDLDSEEWERSRTETVFRNEGPFFDSASDGLAQNKGRILRCRLEDSDGWPLLQPGGEAEFEIELQPGYYRLIILPETYPTRYTTSIESIKDIIPQEGHGPIEISVDTSRQHIWRESSGEVPDVYTFHMPATASVSFELSNEMTGTIIPESGQPLEIGNRIEAGRRLNTILPQGRYRLEVSCSRKNDLLPYRLSIEPDHLVDGSSIPLKAPGNFIVEVGSGGYYLIGSTGPFDVRARLMDHAQRTLSVSDDRPQNWNMQICRYLDPGRYTLYVDPVAATEAETEIYMIGLKENEQPALDVPACLGIQTGSEMLVYPFDLDPAAEAFVISVDADEMVGVLLERYQDGEWLACSESIGRKFHQMMPMKINDSARLEMQRFRFRLWSLDQRRSIVRMGIDTMEVPSVSEKNAAGGVNLQPPDDPYQRFAGIRIDLESAGLFEMNAGSESGLHVTDQLGVGTRPLSRDSLICRGRHLWVFTTLGSASGVCRIHLTRKGVHPGSFLPVELESHQSEAICEFTRSNKYPVVVTASSPGSPPGLNLMKDMDEIDRSALDASAAVMFGSTTHLMDVNAQNNRLIIWNTGPSGQKQEIGISAHQAESLKSIKSDYGSSEILLNAGQAVKISLPSGRKRIHLSAADGILAGSGSDDEIRRTHGRPNEHWHEVLDSDAEYIWLINISSSGKAAEIGLTRIPESILSPVLKAGTSCEFIVPVTADYLIPVEPGGQAHVLNISGDLSEAVLQTFDGKTHSGTKFEWNGAGGILKLYDSRGIIACWMDNPDQPGKALAASDTTDEGVVIKPGEWNLLDKPSSVFRLDAGKPAVAHVSCEFSGIVVLESQSGDYGAVCTSGGQMNIYMPDGKCRILVRGISGMPLAGKLMARVSEVIPIEKNVSGDLICPPGTERYFSFVIDRSERLGIGVFADPDVVSARLLSFHGSALGEGVVQLIDLQPGAYLVAVKVPEDQPPSTVKVSLYHEPGEAGQVPDEVAEQYLKPAGEAR